MAVKKTFNQLTDKDSIYYISPVTLELEGFKIKTITGIPEAQLVKAKALNRHEMIKHWVRIEAFRNTLALQSPDIEQIPTTVFFFDGRNEAQMTVVPTMFGEKDIKKVPVPFFATIDLAKEWMKDTKK